MPKLTLNCSELYPNPIIDDPKNYKVAQKLIKIQIKHIENSPKVVENSLILGRRQSVNVSAKERERR